jgi:acyl-CoA dehydrogenase
MTITESSSVDTLLVDTVERLLANACAFEVVEAAESEGWCAPAWDALAEVGFPWVSISEAAGGSGGSFADAMTVLRSIGRHAAPVPVAETGVLGGWLLAAAGLSIPRLPTTVVPDPSALRLAGNRVVGEAVVAWGRRAERITALVCQAGAWLIVSARPDQLAITPAADIAGEPRDRVRFDVELAEIEHVAAPPRVDGDALLHRGAVSRVLMMAGAMEALCQLTIDYAHARRQFGRSIASFQAVQHHLVTAAQATVRASMAADLAVRAITRGPAELEVAAARVIADQAGAEAARAAHQAHGAMGVTREYPLHHLSRRLWAWRHEYGTTGSWRRRLGTDVTAAGADELFPMVAR